MQRRRFLDEAARFMAVGLVATGVAIALYNWLAYEPYHLWSPLHRHLTWSYIVAHFVGMLVSYELSRRWTFRNRSANKAGEGFVSYAVINIITMTTIPLGCLWFSRHVLDLTSQLSDNLSGNVVGLLLSQAARFYLFRRFVFHRPIRYYEVYDDPADEADEQVDPATISG
ncbi:Putative flippase GtrA (transmembrane translocase of bactoprenol-linked glucose) [Nocardioides terrae]|uniref:Putative flippase GtrA (Transmembrane translocase of bactoprenol-linked glucose) n=1 Tax=Nocardioides terrae TaxID=574651 RepID=A0A1I1MIA6_9ACTN|nr:GtrA family protein [Nocardioides terrae]SFC84582.1 Putative flippase GtrA (transmembrane translocase of bactoprenol-linked glucose) [Nocardioides terrae]